MPDSVVHFEMPSKNKKRTAEFYSNAFGWKMNQLGSEMGDYLIAQTTETDENRMPKKAGAINGGFFDFQDKPGMNIPHLVISVENLEDSMKKVEDAGGKVLDSMMNSGKIDDIPGIGRYATIQDTEGNLVGILEPISK